MDAKEVINQIEQYQKDMTKTWLSNGETPNQFLIKLTTELQSVKDLLEGRSQDTSMVQSALKDSLSLITYACTQKELISLKAIIQSHIAKEKRNGTINTKRAD